MKTLTFTAGLLLASYAQLASAFTVYRPNGFIDVQPTGTGFDVVNMTNHTITSVTKSPNGYVIFPSNGAPTFIDIDNEEERGIADEYIVPSLIDDDLM